MRLRFFLFLFLATFSSGAGDPFADIRLRVDSALSQEKRLYWMKCSRALENRREARSYALRGVAVFLASVPLEYAASRYRFVHKREPVELNAATFVLMGAALLQLTQSYRRYEEYEAGRSCCRYWQDYASMPRSPGIE